VQLGFAARDAFSVVTQQLHECVQEVPHLTFLSVKWEP
jgi:hypothetical protein